MYLGTKTIVYSMGSTCRCYKCVNGYLALRLGWHELLVYSLQLTGLQRIFKIFSLILDPCNIDVFNFNWKKLNSCDKIVAIGFMNLLFKFNSVILGNSRGCVVTETTILIKVVRVWTGVRWRDLNILLWQGRFSLAKGQYLAFQVRRGEHYKMWLQV